MSFHPLLHTFLLTLLLITTSSTTLDLTQPSLITWTTQNKTSTLLTHSFQFLNTLTCTKIGQYPSDYNRDSMNNIVVSDKNVYVYRPVQVLHRATISYYYKGYNGETSQGILTREISDNFLEYTTRNTPDMIISQLPTKTKKLSQMNMFNIYPIITHKTMQYQTKIFFSLDQNPNIYTIPTQNYNQNPTCNSWLSISKQYLQKTDQYCKIKSAQSIVDEEFYQEVFLSSGMIGSVDFGLVFSDLGVGVSLEIQPGIMGSNLMVRSLSQIFVDFSQVTVSVKNFKQSTIQKIKVTIDNKAQTLIYLTLQCTQSTETIYSQPLLLLPKTSQIFQTPISKQTPTDDIYFKLINPLTKQYYTFQHPSKIVKDNDWVSYELDGKSFRQVSKVGMWVIVGVGILGAFVAMGIVGWMIRRKRYRGKNKQESIVKLNKINLQKLQKSNTITLSATSQRQFLDPEIIRPIPPLSILPQLNINFIKDIRTTQASSTTTRNLNSNLNLAQSQVKIQMQGSSQQDRVQGKNRIEIQSRLQSKYRAGNQNNISHVSTETILSRLPRLSMDADLSSQSRENLDNIKI